jgi:hypothetical protein
VNFLDVQLYQQIFLFHLFILMEILDGPGKLDDPFIHHVGPLRYFIYRIQIGKNILFSQKYVKQKIIFVIILLINAIIYENGLR